MNEFDPALVEQAARALHERDGGIAWDSLPEWARAAYFADAQAVLTAVAPALRAEGARPAGARPAPNRKEPHHEAKETTVADLTPETLAAWREDAERSFDGDGLYPSRDRRIFALLDALAEVKAERDAAYQRGMIEGARQVLAAVEAATARRNALGWANDAAREALARIEGGA